MSMKSQNRLPIFSLVILGVTALTIFGLHYVIEQISLKQPVTAVAHQVPPPSFKKGGSGADDSIDDVKMPPPTGPTNRFEGKFNGIGKFPNGMPPPPDMRRLNGGKDAMDLQKKPLKRTKDSNDQAPLSYPPPEQPEYYNDFPPPYERDDYERPGEDDRYPYGEPPYPYDSYPPPDYDPQDYGYPPPSDYDPEDDYYRGYEGKLDLQDKERDLDKEEDEARADGEDAIEASDKTADLKQDHEYDPYPDEEDYEDYIDEYLDEDY